MKARRVISLAFAALVACGGGSSASSSAPGAFPEAPYGTFEVGDRALVGELRTSPTQPPERGIIGAELRVSNADGAPCDGLAVGVVPWMVAHGHGSSVEPVVTAMGGGVYRIERLQLAMPGTWQLRFTFEGAGVDAVATMPLDVQ